MRSDREELPEGFTKEEADRAEIREYELQQRQSAVARGPAPGPGCQQYWPSDKWVCGAIRDKYNSLGAQFSFLLWPTSDELTSPDGHGKFNTFQNGPIYWSAAGGAHPVVNSILNRWGVHGYEMGWLGYPTTDEIVHADGVGRRQEFQNGAIYVAFQNAVSSAIKNGPIRDKWNTVGAETPGSLLGYPTNDEVGLPDGQGRMARFERGVIYWHPNTGAHAVIGEILAQWTAQGYETGPAGYPLEDQRQISAPGVTPVGFEQMFQNDTHAWPRRVSEDYCGPVCTDDVYNQFPEMRNFMDLISQPGAPSCDSLPPAVGEEETFYECWDPSPALSDESLASARGAYVQPPNSILQPQCYDKAPGVWTEERFYSCVYVKDLNGHGVRGDKGQDGGRMNYVDLEIYISRNELHGRKLDIGFRAIPKLSGLGASSILEFYPKCSIPGGSCTFDPIKGYENIHDNEPVEFEFSKIFDAPAEGTATAVQLSFDMKHVSTGAGPTAYKPAPLPYSVGQAPMVRCDSYKGMRGTSDCIFVTAMPLISFSPKYNVPEAEWHITKAQASGLPGGSEDFPLHRATPEQQSASAQIACKSTSAYPPRPAGKQCDEYPFKAAKEGAQMSGAGTERTIHPQCGMTRDGVELFPQASGPTGFSVCMINGSQNGSAGSGLSWLYQRFRVGYLEEFVIMSQPGTAPVPGPVIN